MFFSRAKNYEQQLGFCVCVMRFIQQRSYGRAYEIETNDGSIICLSIGITNNGTKGFQKTPRAPSSSPDAPLPSMNEKRIDRNLLTPPDIDTVDWRSERERFYPQSKRIFLYRHTTGRESAQTFAHTLKNTYWIP